MKASEFGREVTNNPSFINWLRRGGVPRLPTVDKARAWMAGNASVEEARAIRSSGVGGTVRSRQTASRESTTWVTAQTNI